MLTLLTSNTAFSIEDWQKLITKACAETSYKLSSDIILKKDQTCTLESTDSICGLELLLQSNGLKIFLSSLPSRKDFRLFCKIIEAANKSYSVFDDETLKLKLLKKDDFNVNFTALWEGSIEQDRIVVSRCGRRVNLKKWVDNSSSAIDQESSLLKVLKSLEDAKAPDVFPVDGKDSAIWDGTGLWISSTVQMILFSQAYFKGKICGEVSAEELKSILAEKITVAENGFILPEARKLSGEDISRLNNSLQHYEKKEVEKKLENLTIEVGKLEEISYSMSRALFEGIKLSTVTDNYIKGGISKAQLEVAALAVSSMLEIAATSKGTSLDEMQKKLKVKCKLSAEAAFAVASGFVNAAKEAKPNNKKVNWVKLGILVFAVGTLIWFFFIR